MLVFLDESGDPGMKLQQGSSEYFFVTLVIFEDNEEALRADHHIAALREQLRLDASFEFRFNKMNYRLRTRFLREMCGFNFCYYTIALRKGQLTARGFRFSESFYKVACRYVFTNAKTVLRDAVVVIDGSGSRVFQRQLVTYLRRGINPRTPGDSHIRKIKIEDSHRNNLLQLADMVCGALARSYGNKPDAKDYRTLISRRERHVQTWPK
jgi:hypothetical protein